MLIKNEHHGCTAQVLESALQGAFVISSKLSLFEAARMSEQDIRTYLTLHQIVEKELQDKYIDYVYTYRITALLARQTGLMDNSF